MKISLSNGTIPFKMTGSGHIYSGKPSWVGAWRRIVHGFAIGRNENDKKIVALTKASDKKAGNANLSASRL